MVIKNGRTFFKLKLVIVFGVFVLVWKGALQKAKLEYSSQTDTTSKTVNTVGKVLHRNQALGWTFDNKICFQKRDSSFVFAKLNNPPNTPIYVYPEDLDQYISRNISREGSYEGHNVQTLLQYMKQFPKAVFLDLGANIGAFSVPIAAHGYRVIAVECLRSNVMRLCASMNEANLANKMTIVYNALNQKHEKVSLVSAKGNIGMTAVVDQGKGNETIDSILLDDLLEVFNLEQVVIKMDVLEQEDIVLNGGDEFFNKVRVEALLMEFIHHQNDDYNNDGKFIVDLLASHDLEPDVPEHLKHDYKNWETSEILFKRMSREKKEM